MGDLFGSTTTSTTTSQPFSGEQYDWYKDFRNTMLANVNRPARYNGQTSASINPTQQNAIGLLTNGANNPMLQDYAGGKYIDLMSNPYIQAQAGIIKQQGKDAWTDQGGQVNSMFNKGGFWSGSAHQDALKDVSENVNESTSGALAGLFGDAYNTGVGQMLNAQGIQQSAANSMLNAGNTQYQMEDTALTRKYEQWLKEQGMKDEDIQLYLEYLSLGKNPSQTTETESSGLGGIMGSLAGGWASTWGPK